MPDGDQVCLTGTKEPSGTATHGSRVASSSAVGCGEKTCRKAFDRPDDTCTTRASLLDDELVATPNTKITALRPEPPSMSFVPEFCQPNRGLVTFLGTGTSVGVPAIGCDCAVCQSNDPRNNRTRCAITVRLPGGTVLIDTPPDLRFQLIRERMRLVHSVIFTHEHADHIFGLDDLRLIPFRLGHPVPLYCTETVETNLRRAFSYAFTDRADTHPGATPQLEFRRIDESPFEVLGTQVTPIPMKHGPHFSVFGYRIGDFAYCTDTNHVPPASVERLRGVRTLVIGALRMEPHPTHFNLEQAIEVARSVGAQRTLLTHTGHQLDYQKTSQWLPDGVEMAYDGLQLELRL